ncbi:hypothetical protein HK405_004193 [Cladochytrium tenue]|nr:hypothetical protein HK405_004193 [Cladochytrium tenue]
MYPRSPPPPPSWWPATTVLLLMLLATVAAPAVAQIAVKQGQACTAVAYNGTVCPASIMTYQTAVPVANQSALDSYLTSSTAALAAVKSLDTTCFTAILTLACMDAFPVCANGTAELPCYHSCTDVIAACTATLAPLNLLTTLESSLNNCTFVSAIDSEAYPTSNCQSPASIPAAASSTNTTSNTTATTCPKFFLPNTGTATTANCAPNGCCVPCPVHDYFYPVGAFEASVLAVEVGNGISCALAAFVVLSWATLPGRRRHPGDIVLHFAVAIMTWQACAMFLYGNPKRIQCYDSVTVSTASNNLLCGVQAAFVMCAVHATVFWGGYMIANLHATIVWRSSIFERYKPLGIVLCWGLSGVFTFIAFFLATVDATTGVTCLISPDKANYYLFSIQAVIILPAFFLNCATITYIVVVARRAASSANGLGRWQDSSGGQGSIGAQDYSGTGTGTGTGTDGGQPKKTLSQRRQVLQLLKLNWRALLLGLIYVVTYIIYVIFFNVVAVRISSASWATPWVQSWTACVVSDPGTDAEAQNNCAATFAGEVPSFGLIVFSNLLVSLIGVWLFLIFGLNLQIVYEWQDAVAGWIVKLRRRPEQPVYYEGYQGSGWQ